MLLRSGAMGPTSYDARPFDAHQPFRACARYANPAGQHVQSAWRLTTDFFSSLAATSDLVGSSHRAGRGWVMSIRLPALKSTKAAPASSPSIDRHQLAVAVGRRDHERRALLAAVAFDERRRSDRQRGRLIVVDDRAHPVGLRNRRVDWARQLDEECLVGFPEGVADDLDGDDLRGLARRERQRARRSNVAARLTTTYRIAAGCAVEGLVVDRHGQR